jgi:signal transduction histidine kinase
MKFQKLKITDYNNLYPLFFTLVFILIVIQYSFTTLDAIFYDLWVKFDLTTSWQKKVVVVKMDEESDEFLGEVFPYTYATHTRFLKRVLQDNPLALGYITQLQIPEYEVESRYYEVFQEQLEEFAQNNGSIRFATYLDVWGEQLPPEELRRFGYSLGILNQDSLAFARDDVARRALLNVSGENSFHLWMANKIRIANQAGPIESTAFGGNYYNREADAVFALYRYSTSPIPEATQIDSIPFHRVLVGNYPEGFFSDKVVIIGPQYIANSGDYILTPFNKENLIAPKLNLHALIIDALSQGKSIIEVSSIVTDIFAIILALILSFFISRVSPAKGLMLTISLIIGTFIFAFLLFVVFGVWIKLAHIILCIFVVYYIWVPFRAIGEYQTRYKIEEETKLMKQVDRLKQNFISLMSHDLKTPVAKIQGIADILNVQYDNTPEQKKLLGNVIVATKELNGFISSILDLTKIESENLKLNLAAKDVNKIIEDIIQRLKYEAAQKNMQLVFEPEPIYPITIDAVLINRVVSNLIENAIKYAGAGREITISTWDDESWVYVQIKDDGIGIEPEDLEHIFDKFYRVRNDSTHAIKGSGLGLYLVKYFIELHEGTIEAKSKRNEGTTFIIKLKNK